MKRFPLLLAALAALPFAASAADGVSYNYVQGGYVATNPNHSGLDADGVGGDFSVAFHENFHLFGGLQNQEFDNSNFDFNQYRFGVGYNRAIAPSIDLVTRVAYEKLDGDANIDLDGYSTEVGIRGAANDMFEGYALAGWEDYESVDGDFYGKLGAQVKFNANWGLAGEVKLIEGGDQQYFVGPRFTW
jgi:Ax21 family sulfation-dependent quorum factor